MRKLYGVADDILHRLQEGARGAQKNEKECVTKGTGNDNVRTEKERNEVLGRKPMVVMTSD